MIDEHADSCYMLIYVFSTYSFAVHSAMKFQPALFYGIQASLPFSIASYKAPKWLEAWTWVCEMGTI